MGNTTRLVTGSGSKVKLRAKLLRDGNESLYLDYPAVGKRCRESLGITLIAKPKNQLDKQHNKNLLEEAKIRRLQKEKELLEGDVLVSTLTKRKSNFIKYCWTFYNNYEKGDKRLVKSAIDRLVMFESDYIPCNEINEVMLLDFKDYLKKHLNGETPYNYFKKIKKILLRATKEKYFTTNPSEGITNTKTKGIKKQYLSVEEVEKIKNTWCSNQELKDAFIFSCITALRYCDVKQLSSSNIKDDRIEITQQKTKVTASPSLNETAILILNKRKKNTPVFNLPSATACNSLLKTWMKKAEINKHITYHCARVTCAVNLLIVGGDVKSVSDQLGHCSMRELDTYVREVDKLKRSAVHKLPY